MERDQLLHRRRQWERFNAWEITGSRRLTGPRASEELSRTLRWFAEAWELAREANPNWAQAKVDADKIRRLQSARQYLARLTVGGLHDRSRA